MKNTSNMKIYNINEGEKRKIVSVDKISLVQTGDKIDDIILADGKIYIREISYKQELLLLY